MVDVKDLSCPCTLQIMFDPVSTVDGFTFEREFIEEWLKNNSTNPTTNTELVSKTLLPNRQIKTIIDGYLGKNKHLFDYDDEVYKSKSMSIELENDILNKNLDSVSFKLTTLIDYRYFTQTFDSTRHPGYSAFYLAAEFSSPGIVKKIFEYLFSNNYLQNMHKPPANWKPIRLIELMDAYLSVQPFTDLVKSKIKQLLKIHEQIKKVQSDYLETFILKYSANYEIIKLLLDTGLVSLEAKNPTDKQTLIIKAASKNKLHLFLYLLEQPKNKDLFVRQGGDIVLVCLKNKHMEIYSIIVDFLKKNLNGQDIQFSVSSPLHLLISLYKDNIQIVENFLNENKSLVEKCDENGQTPIFLACKLKNKNIAELLIKHGANVNHLDKFERNCLHYAIDSLIDKRQNTNIDFADDYIKNPFRFQKYSSIPNSILKKSIQADEKSLFSLLIEHHVNIHQIDVNDKTPLDLASSREIKNYLINENNMNTLKMIKHFRDKIVELENKNTELQSEMKKLKENKNSSLTAKSVSKNKFYIPRINNQQKESIGFDSSILNYPSSKMINQITTRSMNEQSNSIVGLNKLHNLRPTYDSNNEIFSSISDLEM